MTCNNWQNLMYWSVYFLGQDSGVTGIGYAKEGI